MGAKVLQQKAGSLAGQPDSQGVWLLLPGADSGGRKGPQRLTDPSTGPWHTSPCVSSPFSGSQFPNVVKVNAILVRVR